MILFFRKVTIIHVLAQIEFTLLSVGKLQIYVGKYCLMEVIKTSPKKEPVFRHFSLLPQNSYPWQTFHQQALGQEKPLLW